MRSPLLSMMAALLVASGGALHAADDEIVTFNVPVRLAHINQHVGVTKVRCDVRGIDPWNHQQGVLAHGHETYDTGGWPLNDNGTVAVSVTIPGASINGVNGFECYLLLGDQKPSPTASDARLRPAPGTQFVPLVFGFLTPKP